VRLANLNGRAVLVQADDTAVDIHLASNGAFGPDAVDVYTKWDDFRQWEASLECVADTVAFDAAELSAPSPAPRQIVAIGLNYTEHAAESGFAVPDNLPPTFTKFVSSLTGPVAEVELPNGGNTDWEVELVVVIGKGGRDIAESEAWNHVAGLTLGQDLSERVSQLWGPAPQFGLGKSFRNFAPVGPWLVTVDEFEDPDDIEIGCSLDGEVLQRGRTSDLVFPVGALISRLSQIINLFPGDLIFTGTPAGVGVGRNPKRFVAPGQTLVSWAKGIGEIRQSFVAAPHPSHSERNVR
jgi:2-keto-4-pentenoate hydratase/2-oxohepta-3-ene-1,7-dioic acid hydratase in catechol pathway